MSSGSCTHHGLHGSYSAGVSSRSVAVTSQWLRIRSTVEPLGLVGQQYVAPRLRLTNNWSIRPISTENLSSSSMPPPISGHDLMAIFPTAPPSSTVCCNDIFSKQARAYLSGSREGTATAQGDAPNSRPNWTAPGGSRSEQSQSHPRANGLDALAEQACLESSSVRTPPDRPGGGSRNADRSEQDVESGSGRQPRGRHSKVCGIVQKRSRARSHSSTLSHCHILRFLPWILRPHMSRVPCRGSDISLLPPLFFSIKAQRDGGLPRDATPDRRTTTPRPSSSSQADTATPLFTRRPLERTSYPRFVPQ